MNPIIEKRLPQLRELCRRYHVVRLDVFGPAASEQFDSARSDLDFMVEFLPVPAAMTMGAYLSFKEAMEQLLGREV